jgi:TDG/mug DNA glycosylase family protein
MAPDEPWRPTRAQIEAARGRTIPDVIAPGLEVLFSGINPSLYSGAVGHHFARPGNRFWRVLHQAGFTDQVLSPFEDRELLRLGLGVTNLVRRATRSADELTAGELGVGARRLQRLAARYRPAFVAVVGVAAYRIAFGRPRARIGPQDDPIAGARLWLLPNPSGRTAAYQLDALIETFGELRLAVRGSSATGL